MRREAWAPPDAAPPGAAARLRAAVALAEVRALFPFASLGLLDGLDQLTRLHPAEPHWYLAFVGVDPSLRGQGIGSTLLAPVLQRADADGVPCYLATPLPETLALYGRLGFEIVSRVAPFPSARPLWMMLRHPGSAHPSG